MTVFRPLLAARVEKPENIRLPVYGSPKLDGIRVVCHPELGLVTRKLKSIPNAHVREVLEFVSRSGLDGELIVGNPTDPDVYNRTQSGVMSRDGRPDFRYYVFDRIGSGPYLERYASAASVEGIGDHDHPILQLVPHTLLETLDEIQAEENRVVDLGYEGLMLRSPDGPYKMGRSTEREGTLLKLKRFEDEEAVIIDWAYLEINRNEATINELGYTKRSTHKANQEIDTTRVGAVKLRGIGPKWRDVEFWCGSGFDDDFRRDMASKRDTLVGRVVTFKFQAVGSKDAPRMPIFRGFTGKDMTVTGVKGFRTDLFDE